jgi:hypothetical protein
MAKFLTTASDVRCPHGPGGKAILTSENVNLSTNRKKLLLQTDRHSLLPGCTLPQQNRCTMIIWLKGGQCAKHNGIELLTSNSEGKCMPSMASAKITDAAQEEVQSDG